MQILSRGKISSAAAAGDTASIEETDGMTAGAPRLLAEGFMFLEAPKWREGILWVSDVFAHEIHALSENGRRIQRVAVPNRPSGLGFLSDGTLIVASAKDRKLLQLHGERLSDYADLSPYAAGWVNDFAVDPQDRIFVGDFGYDYAGGEPPRPTHIHRVDPSGAISSVAEGVEFPNGSVVIDGGRTLIVAETWACRITAFDVELDGKLSNRRIFVNLGHRQPDGLCADAEGALWVGIYNTGEFVRVEPGGKITDVLQFDGSGISCTLGGQFGGTLFLTTFLGSEADMTAGKHVSAVYTVEVDVPGLM
jgi:sugar lactone lactonase YvrE